MCDILRWWTVYQFTDGRGRAVISEWLRDQRVPVTQVAAFQQKLDALERGGPDSVPGFVVGPIKRQGLGINGIHKLKIKGNKGHVQLRPMICFGPFPDELDSAMTLLVGAIEKDGKLDPHDCLNRADVNRAVLLADPKRRRRQRLQGGTAT